MDVAALVVAAVVVAAAVAAGFTAPRPHRRDPGRAVEPGPRPEGPRSAVSPVEARRTAGPSYFTPPGA